MWVPGREPNLEAEGVGDLRVERRPGGFLASGCARGDYTLRGAPAEAAAAPPAAGAPCRSRRRIVINARGRPTRVTTRGVKPRRITRRGRRIVLDLRGSAKGRIVVSIRLRGGRTERRVYRTCTPGRA